MGTTISRLMIIEIRLATRAMIGTRFLENAAVITPTGMAIALQEETITMSFP